MQCGHFASRVHLATRFEPGNVRPQCIGCNLFGAGRVATFASNLEAQQPGIVNNLYKKAQEITKWSTKDYEEKIEHYKILLEELNK